MSHQVSRETALKLARLHTGLASAKFAGEAIINQAITVGNQIVAEVEAAYQQQLASIIAECGLPEGTTVTVNFDTGEVTVADGVAVPA